MYMDYKNATFSLINSVYTVSFKNTPYKQYENFTWKKIYTTIDYDCN